VADEPEDQETQAAPPRAAKPVGALRWLPVAVLLLVLQSAGAFYVIQNFLPLGADEAPVQETEEGRVRVLPEGDEPEASVDLGEVVANARTDKARLFVVASVTLAVGPKAAAAEIESDETIDRVKDQVIAALSAATPEQLQTVQGRDDVKGDIRSRVNDFLYKGQVIAVYFSSFYLQANTGYGVEN
jgi:flagellar FliL protein